MSRGAFRGALLAAVAGAVPALAAAYLDGPPPGHTGGFGEPTCRACHVEGPADGAAPSLALLGAPERWEPGATYPLEVVLSRPGLEAGGFQLAARFTGGADGGRQAGGLAPVGARVAVIDSAGILYAEHARGGTRAGRPDTVRWRVAWTAPVGASGAVAFHVAANAANDDDSEFGDRIVTLEAESAAPDARRSGPDPGSADAASRPREGDE